MTRIEGGCHCGNIRFDLHWPLPEIPVRDCGCSFCQKHGGAWTSHPQAALEISIVDRSLISKYRFGTATAEFQVCSFCGVVPLVTCNLDDKLYAVVNTNAFDGSVHLTFSRASANFDGEELGDRIARRKRNWISDTKFVEAGT
jgi:hypothetical protein